MSSLAALADNAAIWFLGPILVLAALAMTFVLGLPQFARIGDAFRALFAAPDPKAPGTISPRSALAFSLVASIGAGAVVSLGTAVALGGPGTLAWLWLFGLLLAPLRLAETLLARSAPPGKAGKVTVRGTLAARLSSDASPQVRQLGAALAVLVPLAGFVFVGGSHGAALGEVAEELLPGSALGLGIAAGVLAVVLVLVPRARESIGWVSLVAFIALLLALSIAILHAPGRAFGMFPRAIDDAFSGAPDSAAFAGALTAEVAAAAVTILLPSFLATTGLDSAFHAEARAPNAKVQASLAMLGVLGHVLVVTLVGMALVGTGAFNHRTETTRSLDEVLWVDSAFETPSQRLEADRHWTGYLRVIDGELAGDGRELATERGMITSPTFTEADGSNADFAARVSHGRINHLLRLDDDGALDDVPLSGVAGIRVHGEMLPRGGALVVSALERGGGDLAARLGLAALLLLAALAAAAWGFGIRTLLPKELSESSARIGAGLPALGLVLGATGLAPWLGALGTLVVVATAVVALLGIVSKAREIQKL